MPERNGPSARAPDPTDRARAEGGRRRATQLLVTALLVAPGLLVLPIGAPAFAAAVTPATGGNSTWAWGVASHESFAVSEAGNINSSSIPGANLTGTAVSGALSAAVAEQYANYAVVTVNLPNATDEAVELQAVVYRGVELQAAVSAQLPLAGTYAPGQVPPTAPVNGSIAIAEASLDADVAFLNLTVGTNGSLAVTSEHVEILRAFNISAQFSSYPNATTSSNGSTTVKYVSGAISASGIAVANLTAAFSPAVRVYDGPVANGTTWNTTSQATFTGAVAESVQYTARAPGGLSAHWAASEAETAAATETITVSCVSTDVLAQGGSNGSEVQCTSTGNVTLGAEGVGLLPSSALGGNGTSGSAPANGADPSAAESAVPAHPIYYAGSRAPQSVEASPQSGDPLTAAPMSPSDARSQMTALRAPSPSAAGSSGSPLGAVIVIAGVATLVVVVVAGGRRQRLR